MHVRHGEPGNPQDCEAEAQAVTPCRLPHCSATLTGSSIKEGDLLMLARKGGAAEGAPPQSHPMAVDREGNPLNPQVHSSGCRSRCALSALKQHCHYSSDVSVPCVQ